jgi:hypothetical protein
MIFNKVLLPQPLGPTMEMKFPAATSKETFSNAVTTRAPPVKTRETDSAVISGVTAMRASDESTA